MKKNEMNSKPRRAQGGMGLLSRTISIQNPQVSIPLIPRDEREEERRRRGRQGEDVLLFAPGKKGEEGEGVREIFIPPPTLDQRLNYP